MSFRKHKGINKQTGKLKKGYKYSGKKLKSGLPQIIKIQKKKKTKVQKGSSQRSQQVGGELDLPVIKKEVQVLKVYLETGGPGGTPVRGMHRFKAIREIRELTQKYNKAVQTQDELDDYFADMNE